MPGRCSGSSDRERLDSDPHDVFMRDLDLPVGSHPRPHRALDGVRPELGQPFTACLLGSRVLHCVILRHPPPSGRSS
jgi:hypothetical protein